MDFRTKPPQRLDWAEEYNRSDNMKIDDIIHNLEALDFNSKEAREIVKSVMAITRKETLRWVQLNIIEMKPYPKEPRTVQSYSDGKRDLADDIINLLDSELIK